jgi:alanine dehydrogenase
MIIGVPTEIKQNESRVALRPTDAQQLVNEGHKVIVQHGAGIKIGLTDEQYLQAGAQLVATPEHIFEKAQLIVKVKEPQPEEIALLKPHHLFFGYLHLAGSLSLTESCLQAGFTGLAYETLESKNGDLPLLTPMSEIAGRLAIQSGAKYLEQPQGGKGILLGGVPGVLPANVLVLGGGIVGRHAAQIAAGMGANVIVMDINLDTLRRLDVELPANVTTQFNSPQALNEALKQADLVIGAVLLPGQAAPKLLSREHLKLMKAKSVFVDVCIDQGGCADTSRPTTHASPIFEEEDILHYCVANMPGAVAKTSTQALCNATFPYVRRLANKGLDQFLKTDTGHAKALNLSNGQIMNAAVADAFSHLPNCF